mmetsp:Transcript_24064/g.27255  ORF Transcript_24064/g.27255 Transcript_24064/m.27255 type:complete len:96 (-) Transcript_24064:65-352(-)
MSNYSPSSNDLPDSVCDKIQSTECIPDLIDLLKLGSNRPVRLQIECCRLMANLSCKLSCRIELIRKRTLPPLIALLRDSNEQLHWQASKLLLQLQ